MTHTIDLPEGLARALDDYPVFMRARKVEDAINAALDAAGAPKTDDRSVEHPLYYVNVWHVKGRTVYLKGHVGPITAKARAYAVENAWKKAGFRARLSGVKMGDCLTQHVAFQELRS